MKKFVSIACLLSIILTVLCGCDLFTKKVESVALSETGITIEKGEEKALGVTFLPEGTTTTLEWSSSDYQVVRIDNDRVIGVAPGKAVVTVKTPSGLTASCNVTVNKVSVEKLTINKNTASTVVGKSVSLSVTPTPTDADLSDVVWSSDDTNIAKVNSNGDVTGVSEGVANISCKTADGKHEAVCTVTISLPMTQPSTTSTNPTASTATTASNNSSADKPKSSQSKELFPNSSVSKLSKSEIESVIYSMSGSPVSGSFAQDGINEIYARHGYIFKSSELNNYYSSMSWYTPNASFSFSNLNDIENYNIKLLSGY